MNIIDYIDKNGKYTFLEKELNEVDKLIFSNLSYVDFKDLLDNNFKNKRSIESVGEEFFKRKYDKEKRILAIKGGIKALKAMYKTKRYKDLLIYNYEKVINANLQFSALTIEINKNLLYISFEGTDESTIGWKEDFELSYKNIIESHKMAIRYLNRFTFKDCKLIVGGHSKGGNLALVSAMYTNFIVRNKIINIYSYDGPGLLRGSLHSKRYMKIKDKYIHIIPNNSVVGIMLYSTNNVVIKTKHIGILSHFILNWEVDLENLVSDKMRQSTIDLQIRMNSWIEKYNDEQKKIFVEELFDIFEKNNIKSLIVILEKPSILIKLLKEKSKMNNEMFKDFEDMVKNFIFANIKETITKKQ